MRVTVVGAGYVGAVSAAVLAYLGNRVTCIERDPDRLAAWRRGEDPLREPGLGELLRTVDVCFAPIATDLADSEVIVVAVGTPMGSDGRPDLEQVETASAQIGSHARRGAQAVGADAAAVLGSMGLDPRIGWQFLRPGLGWGGSCFPKDTRALQAIADGMGYDFLVLKAAIDQNARQLRGFAAAIERVLPHGSQVGLLGLAFKAGTADTRESPAVALAGLLLQAGLSVNAYDPAVRVLPAEPRISVRSTLADACEAADAVVVATEWPEVAAMDLRAIRRATRGDLLFDGRSLIAPRSAPAPGFRYAGPAGFMDGSTKTKAVASPRLGTAA